MKGGVYSDQNCPICKKKFKHFEPRGLWCPEHPDISPTKFVVRFGKLTRRFSSYDEAYRCLTGLRYETDEGKFDIRDYKHDKPLGFETLSRKWLSKKKGEVSYNHYRNLRNDIRKATAAWGQLNIKDIGYAEIEDFIDAQINLSQKSKANLISCLRNFWRWAVKRNNKNRGPRIEIPEFPEIKNVRLNFRNIVDKETQGKIIAEVDRISNPVNPKIGLAVKLLSTYVSIRPGELIKLQEKDIDTVSGHLIINSNKDRERQKWVPLIPEHIEIFKSFPPGLPDVFFFRHAKSNGAAKPGQRFGKDYLYKWWKKACKNLGIDGVDLYGGTRHSSTVALREFHTPEEIKRATMHSTNKAFERYLQRSDRELRSIYADANDGGKNDNEADNGSDNVITL